MFPNKYYWGDTYYWEFAGMSGETASIQYKDMVLTVFGDDGPHGQPAPRLGHFVFTREGLAEALKACGYKNPEEWG